MTGHHLGSRDETYLLCSQLVWYSYWSWSDMVKVKTLPAIDVFILTRVSTRVSECMCVRTAVFHIFFLLVKLHILAKLLLYRLRYQPSRWWIKTNIKKVKYTWHSTSSWIITYLRSAQVWHMFSRYLTVLPAHVQSAMAWAIPAFVARSITLRNFN